MFYDGNPRDERASCVLRIAPTFLRFGSFEIFKATARRRRSGPPRGTAPPLQNARCVP